MFIIVNMATYKICLIKNNTPENIQNKCFHTYNLKYNYTVLDCLNKYENENKTQNKTENEKISKHNDTNNNVNNDTNTYIVINNNYISYYNENINTILNKLQTHTLIIECIPKLIGGGIGNMIESIIQIGKVFIFLIDLVIWFGKFIVWLVFFIMWLFKFLFYDLLTDVANGLLVILITICKLPIEICVSLVAYFTNSIGGWMTTIWGWDQSNLTKRDKNSNYFRSVDRTKGKKCFLTNTNTVPFSILLGTIICPPLGVFMNLGVTGWFNILICIFLTLCYYLPGLFYALLVIYA